MIREALLVAVGGTSIGLVVAVWVSGFLKALLFEVSIADPAVIAASVAVLLGSALAACCLPARRAARVDPMEALRAD